MKSDATDLLHLPGRVEHHIPLAPCTSLRMGGPARILWTVDSMDALSSGLRKLHEAGIPWFVLGGGSNLLVSEKGYEGVVIRLGPVFSFVEARGEMETITLSVGAATPFSKLLQECVKGGLAGLDFIVGVPAQVGGAIAMNFGAFGHEIRKYVRRVKVMGLHGECAWFENPQMEWEYRKSIIQKGEGIVTEVEFELEQASSEEVQQKILQNQTTRRTHQPLEYLSCGCMFKNPVGRSAGELIDQSGCKGWKRGEAMISTHHANFLLNMGHASSEDARELIQQVQERVRKTFHIELEPEIRYIGFGDGGRFKGSDQG